MMKTDRFIKVKLIVLVVLFLVVTSTMLSCNQGSNSIISSSDNSITLTKLDQEALEQFKSSFDKQATKLGDSYYHYNTVYGNQRTGHIRQLKDVSFRVNSSVLSDADKLNKIEWIGWISVHIKLKRLYNEASRKCEDWFPYGDDLRVTIEKRNGIWNAGVNDNTKVEISKIPECLTKE